MTSFISSFLVEPVIRQARRFSRPSSDPARITGNGPLTDDGDTSVERKNVETTAVEDDDTTASVSNGRHGILGDAYASTSHHVVASPIASPVSETVDFPATSDPVQALPSSSRGFLSRADSTHREEVARERERWSSWPNNYSNPALNALPRRLHADSGSTTHSLTSIDSEMTPVEGSNLFASEDEQRGRSTSNNSKMGDGALPADDGMGKMRRKIIEIQNSGVSSEEKSRLVHRLMTENYASSQSSLHNPSSIRLRSPESLRSQDGLSTPTSLKSPGDARAPIALPSGSALHEEFKPPSFPEPTPEDLAPTYYIKAASNQSLLKESPSRTSRRPSDDGEEERHLGCPHYRRNVKLQCSQCLGWYTCRFCHDAVEDHSLIRRDTRYMLCMLCGTAQAASAECTSCGVQSAWYYCDVCKLWNDDPQKSVYHCEDCGICRVGQGLGKDFYHCQKCSICLSISMRDTHRCIERSTDCDCPICGEYLFNSPKQVAFLPRCSHSIHHGCYVEHIKSSYRCPICSRSLRNMEMTFKQIDRDVESQPMPLQFQDTKALVYCNDCSARTTVRYHWLGLKCAVCESYNTAQIQLLRDNGEGATLPEALTDRAPSATDMVTPETTPDRRPRQGLSPLTRGRSFNSNAYLLPTELESTLEDSASNSYLQMLSRSNPSRPASTGPESMFTLDSESRRRVSSMPPAATERSLTRHSSSFSLTAEGTDTEEDVDDVDFWGGVSPRERAADEARLQGGSERSPIRFWQSSASRDGNEDDREDDSDDYDDDDDDDDDDDESTIEDDEDDGAEEIIVLAGHR